LTIITTIFFIEESWPKSKREKTEKEVKIKIHIFRNRDALYLLGQFAFHSLSFIMYVSTLAIFLGIVLGLDTIGVSIMLTISGISRAIVRFSVFNLTIKRLGEKKMTILGLSILVVTFFLIGIFGTFYKVIWIFVLLMVFASYGVSCSRGILISRVTQSVSPREIGKINGYTTTLDSIAQIVGPILGTFLLQGFPTATYIFGAVMAIFALGAFLMDFRETIPFLEKSKLKETVSFVPE